MNEHLSLSFHNKEITPNGREKSELGAPYITPGRIDMGWLSDAVQSFNKLENYFAAHDENNISALELFEWARAQDIAPIALETSYRLLVKHGCLLATIEMFDLWIKYSVEYAGEAETMERIEQELGCKLIEATASNKIAFFTPKQEAPNANIPLRLSE